MPTCLAAAGTDVPGDVDGTDLLAVTRLSADDKRVFVGDCRHRFFCVVDGRWKYHWTALGGAELLFDRENDPCEQNDLHGDSAHGPQLETLRAQLVAHLAAKGSDLVKDGVLQSRSSPRSRRDVSRYPGF